MAMGLLGCGEVEGNGHIIEEQRGLSGFTAVANDSSLPVSIVVGSDFSVLVRIDSNLVGLLVSRVDGGVLRLEEVAPFHATDSSGVSIVLPALDAAHNVGSGDMTVSGVQGSGGVDLTCAGSGSLSFSGTTGALDAELTGSGSLSLVGSGGFTSIRLTGSGSADASAFAAEGATLDVSGSGSVLANVAGDATLTTTGSGSITATLNGGNATFSVEGSGSIVWSGDEQVASVTRTGSGSVSHQ